MFDVLYCLVINALTHSYLKTEIWKDLLDETDARRLMFDTIVTMDLSED